MRGFMAGRWFAGLMLALAAGPALADPAIIDGGRFGTVRLSEPQGEMRGLVMLFSDHGADGTIDDAAAAKLAAAGALVIEVDSDRYFAALAGEPDRCFNLGGDIEGLSRQLQRDRAYPTYRSPILAGAGVGGILAEVALSQVPPATYAGAVSLDPATAIPTVRPLCSHEPFRAGASGYHYGPHPDLQGFWDVGFTAAATRQMRDHVANMAKGGTHVDEQELDGKTVSGETLADLVLKRLGAPEVAASGLAALPLTELPVAQPSGLMAIVISGDGGWRDLDKTIAETLQQEGVPTVGWDSLRYFWSRKTPDETAHALAQVMKAYMAKWHATKVALIGYSFGADILPFAYNRLPADLKPHVASMALLGFAQNADFEITVSGWLGGSTSDDALPIKPEIAKVPPQIVQCFYGIDEDDTLCPDLAQSGVEQIKTAGGHHFDGDYDALAKHILDGLKQRAG